MEDHVEEESPDFLPLVRTVDKRGVDGERAGARNLSVPHRVVREDAQLRINKSTRIHERRTKDELAVSLSARILAVIVS
jgi:hypothetical protein